MIPNIQGILLSAEFKGIPASILEPQEFIDKVVPKGFDDIIQTSTDGFDVFLNQIHLDGTLSDNDILITKTVYTSDNVVFPKFAITNLSNNTYILNQNQILHLMLTYRFNQFRTMTRFYMNLISKDVASVMRYVQYVLPHSYNTKIKINNSVCFMVFKDMGIVSSEFSEWFASSRVTEAQWKTIFAQHNISLSSVGSMQKSDTVVINPEPTNQLYRSVGYWETDKGFISIFPPSQNVPARHQSHTIGECYKLLDSSQSVFQQDNVIVDGKLQRKDNCLREAIIVFHPTTETNEFLSGEIEASLDVANQLVEVKYNIEDCISQLYVSKGQTVYPDFKDYLLADSLLGQQIILKDFKQFTVVDIETTGINSSRKIRITGLKRAGNARIISNTGLKGVTKVVNNLGVIKFYPSTESTFEEQVNERIQSDNWLKELKERYPNTDFDSLDEYPPIEKEHFHEIKPDMICGMNSVKAKSNTIVLARAALAVKLGYYVPSEKFGFKGLLDTLDENEINTASQALPDFIYLDKNGNQVKVEIGLVYVTYTELTSIYTRVKLQSFSFEAGRNLALDGSSSNALYKYIWDNYLDKELVEMSQELYKILMLSETGTFNNQDQLPVYNLEEINKIFTQNDLVLSSRNEFPSESKLLDESFNQGFFIDLSKYQNAPVIRIPSAKSLKMFSGVLKNGNTIYHPNLISVSKIIRGCLKVNNSYALNTIYSKDKSRTTSALAYNSYINTIQATLFSTPEVSQQVIQSLIKPEIMGCSFKMVNEPLLPDNVVLITDDSVFKRLKTEALKCSDSTLEDYQVKLVYLSSKYDSLSKDEKTELFEELNKDCPFGLAMRNPQLT